MFEFILFIAISTFTPGPNNILAMHIAVHSGIKDAAKYISGTFIGFVVVFNICGFGNLLLSQYLPVITNVVQYIGFSFILYMAYKIFKSANPIDKSEPANASVIFGIVFQFINPKIWFAGLTIYSIYIFEFSQSPLVIFGSAVGISLVGVLSQFLWSIFGLLIEEYYNNHYKLINTIMSLSLLYLAFSIIH